jgi:lysophospholipase L1-like esterase
VASASAYIGSPNSTTRPNALTFGGEKSVLVPAGGTAASDPLAIKVPALSDVTVNIFLPDQTIETPTCHESAIATNLILAGDQTLASTSTDSKPYNSWCFLKDLQVQVDKKAETIVALGDSITDGAHSTVGANHRWPDYLAARLQANSKTAHLSIINEGFGGNRILFNGHGPSAAARFDRDVLTQADVKYLVLLEGINDIDQTIRPDSAEAELTVQQLVSAVTQMVQRAHAHGIKVFGATLTPNGNRTGVTPHVNELRSAYNQWLRTAGVVDAVIDFDKAARDIQQPDILAPEK